MNFWRLTNSKKFSNFHIGDYLFFLVKGTEKPGSKEKGILGYGHLVKTQTLSFQQMWNTYKQENGYDSKEELYEAIIKVSKDKTMPTKINSLYLDHVIFFQNPVYPSEVGVTISNRLESYTYLDQEDPQVTAKILNCAKKGGIDYWSIAMNNEEISEDFFEEEEISHNLSNIIQKASISYTDWEYKKARKWIRDLLMNHPEIKLIKGSKTEAYYFNNGVCRIYLPFVSGKNLDNATQAMIGHACLINSYIKKEYQYQIRIQFQFLSDCDMSELEKEVNAFLKEY